MLSASSSMSQQSETTHNLSEHERMKMVASEAFHIKNLIALDDADPRQRRLPAASARSSDDSESAVQQSPENGTKPDSSRIKLLETMARQRPFLCTGCGMRFKLKHHLTRHTQNPTACLQQSRLHAGVHSDQPAESRPYICSGCGMRFKLKHHLKRHSRSPKACEGAAVIYQLATDPTLEGIAQTTKTGAPDATRTVMRMASAAAMHSGEYESPASMSPRSSASGDGVVPALRASRPAPVSAFAPGLRIQVPQQRPTGVYRIAPPPTVPTATGMPLYGTSAQAMMPYAAHMQPQYYYEPHMVPVHPQVPHGWTPALPQSIARPMSVPIQAPPAPSTAVYGGYDHEPMRRSAAATAMAQLAQAAAQSMPLMQSAY